MIKTPKRIVFENKPGWKKPDGAVFVTGNSIFANKFHGTKEEKFLKYQRWLAKNPGFVETIRKRLKGLDLVCSCEKDEPCHADLLLLIANLDNCEIFDD